jgi:hypothetical protein
MQITPTPAFMEAVRQVLGIDALVPSPAVVLPALRDPALGPQIEATHRTIVDSRAGRLANEQAAEMRSKLDGGLTPADMGFKDQTADQLVASEWKTWFDEEGGLAA